MLARLRKGLSRLHPATWLAWLLPVFAWAPLTYPGYFAFLSGFSPVFNLDDALRGGLSVGWLASLGPAHDLLRSERALPYALALLLRLLGASGVAAVKLLFAASVLAGALGTYGWARRRLGAWPALVAAAVYAFWPPGLATIYVRGALGEAVLLGLLPFVWWAADAAVTRRSGLAAAGLGLGLAAAFAIEAGLAFWLAGLVLIYLGGTALPGAPAGVPEAERSGRPWPILAGWLGGVLAGVLSLAAAAPSGFPGVLEIDFLAHLVYPHQLLQPGWSLAPGVAGPYDAMPLQLGLAACSLALLGVVLTLAGETTSGIGRAAPAEEAGRPSFGEEARPSIWLPVILAGLPVLLSLSPAAALWRALPFLTRTLIYPWQLLLLSGPWLAWLAGLGAAALGLRLRAPDGSAWAESPEAGGQLDSSGLAGAVLPATHTQPPAPTPLFAALIGLALLGIYGDLNPPTIPPPVPDRPVAIFGKDQIALLDAHLSPAHGAAGAIVRVRWQALRPLAEDYTVFFHVLGPDGALWGQQDITLAPAWRSSASAGVPRADKYPTSQWRPGEVVEDEYSAALKPGAPPGSGYQYVLGLYQYRTGRRLQTGADDKVVLNVEG